ncbi:(R)-hydratase [Camelimonas fluminis]|uniref:MaoC family dehydratase n=1 Tax=Camelimonas fluminis TaxID=1576911 RepID=A0ABV7UCP6_9HYPH|nr:MaoC family dehydratase [Camelimonas fluminis]GHE47022.1 (R)-hydratase [Camelimonas fluminis]
MGSALQAYAFDDLRLGMRETLMRTIMETHISDFAAITGDRNPLLLDEAFAAQSLFGQRIAHGMFTAGMISALIGTRLPGPGSVYLSQTLQFLAPVRIGDVVTAAVEVVELVPARQRVRLFCECVADGRGVLEGEAWVAMPENASGLPPV